MSGPQSQPHVAMTPVAANLVDRRSVRSQLRLLAELRTAIEENLVAVGGAAIAMDTPSDADMYYVVAGAAAVSLPGSIGLTWVEESHR